MKQVELRYPGIDLVLEAAGRLVPQHQRQMLPYQAACLSLVVTEMRPRPKEILEIGTAAGYSAAILALSAPQASIVSLNPRGDECAVAQDSLQVFQNVKIVQKHSWDFLQGYQAPVLDVIWIDGDHKQVQRDLPWFNHLRDAGLIAFHDFSPIGASHPCPSVFEVVGRWRTQLGRDFDVLVIDDEHNGMAGFYKRQGEHVS